ncbi:MAG: NTP transferase domain-containing protein [Candidatus Cloacimonetes bacterium]|nr:NTP transferase domain-containing protein [Candidatus Cloacimonadota bacterium]
MKRTATIILAAGKGTRMKSEKPKVVFELAGKPMINRVISTAMKVDSDIIATVVGYKKDVVIDATIKNEKIKFVEQVEQNGTGHAVMVTRDEFANFDGDVFILCGDVPLLRHQTLEKILKEHRSSNASCTVLTAFMDDALRYGRIVRNNTGNVQRIVEFKDATEQQKEIKEINTGIYCFKVKDLFDALDNVTNENNQNEYYLTDTLEILNRKNKLVTSVILDDMIEASGVNSQEQLSELENEYLKNQNHYDL